LKPIIGFHTEVSLKRSLGYYLELPADRGYQVVYGEDNGPRLAYLKKLESITKILGSNVAMSYKDATGMTETEELRGEPLRQLQKEMLRSLPKQPSEYMQLHSIIVMYGCIITILHGTHKARGKSRYRL
jgi:hypothetical protein